MIIIVYAASPSSSRFISGAIVLKFTDRILFVSISQHFTWKHNPNYVSFWKFLLTCWSALKCPIGGCKNWKLYRLENLYKKLSELLWFELLGKNKF